MRHWMQPLLWFALVFFLLGFIVLPGGFGPALVQMWGSAAACLLGSWLLRERSR